MFPRKLQRAIGATALLLTMASFLLYTAHRYEIINLPTIDILSQFQPESLLYLVDLRVTTCRFYNFNDPNCGLPAPQSGPYGDLAPEGWQKLLKDLQLLNSWLAKQFLVFKKIDAAACREQGCEVIVDLAIANSTDCAVKGNKACVPQYILNKIALSGVGSDDAQAPAPAPVTPDQIKLLGWREIHPRIWACFSKTTKNAITGVEVLFGPDAVDPRPNWDLMEASVPVSSARSGMKPRITFRRGPVVNFKAKEYQPDLKYNAGKFKILQVADMHFSTGVGVCRDRVSEDSKAHCEADPQTLKFLEHVLSIENPDFVVLTGDQVFGHAAPDSETALLKAVSPFIERKIPFALTLGNHDDEGSLLRPEMMQVAASLPYCVAVLGPDSVDGYGNYAVSVADKNAPVAMYFLDSHSYSPAKNERGYDWFKELQVIWLGRESQALKAELKVQPENWLLMAFFHIPLPEFRSLGPMVGKVLEGITASSHPTDMRKELAESNIHVALVGHDHVNDFCLNQAQEMPESEIHEMWLCYGGGSGEGGYGGYGGYIRRMRVYEIESSTRTIRTWKRAENNPSQLFDDQVLVEGGKVKTTV